MARKKKAKDTIPIRIEVTEPNRYGSQAIYNETGVHCCCHMVPLTDICDGCEALRDTKRKPTLVGVDAVRMKMTAPLPTIGSVERLELRGDHKPGAVRIYTPIPED